MNWKRIRDIGERNAKALEDEPDLFLKEDVAAAQSELLLKVWAFIDEFESHEGVIKKTKRNFWKVNGVDSVFSGFASAGGLALVGKMIGRMQRILGRSFKYFGALLGKTEKVDTYKQEISEMLNRRLGINSDGSLKNGGYVHDLQMMDEVRNEIREQLYNSVIAGYDLSAVKKDMKLRIVGDKNLKGAIERFYSKFAYDSFSKIDRMTSSSFAKSFGLTMFVYAGIIIENSRPFCRKKLNGIYTIEEAKKWPYETPGPLGIEASYDPVVDMGGVNCKHMPMFITEEMAEEMVSNGYVINK